MKHWTPQDVAAEVVKILKSDTGEYAMQVDDIALARRIVDQQFNAAKEELGTGSWSFVEVDALHARLLNHFAHLTTIPLADPLMRRAQQEVLRLVDLDPEPGTPDSDWLQTLGASLETYEKAHIALRELMVDARLYENPAT